MSNFWHSHFKALRGPQAPPGHLRDLQGNVRDPQVLSRTRGLGGYCYKERYEHSFPNSIHFPFMTFTWLHPWFITYPTLREYLRLLLISTSCAVIVLYIVNSHCLHFCYNILFFFLLRLSHDHMLHSSYSCNCHSYYCSYCSLLSSSSISISADHSSINT